MKLAQQQRLAAQYERQGSGQFGEKGGYYSSQSRHETDDSVSRLIYLSFSSESTFKQEDVFFYFSDFGTVDDVRIPHQQERVFGFVCFANAETVKTILAQGNLHIICDSVVLVKSYKDKSERQQLIERGPRMMRSKTDSQLAKEAELQLPERENESIDHPQPSLSLDSLLLQPERNTQGESDIGESHLQLVANRNEGPSNEKGRTDNRRK